MYSWTACVYLTRLSALKRLKETKNWDVWRRWWKKTEVKVVFKVAALKQCVCVLNNTSKHLIVKQGGLFFILRASTSGFCTPSTSALPEKQLTESNALDRGFRRVRPGSIRKPTARRRGANWPRPCLGTTLSEADCVCAFGEEKKKKLQTQHGLSASAESHC